MTETNITELAPSVPQTGKEPERKRKVAQSRPKQPKELLLQTSYAQRAAKRALHGVSQACYTVQVYLVNVADRHQELQPLFIEHTELLQSLYKEFDELITKALGDVDTRMNAAALDSRTAYTRPQSIQIDMTSPGMMQFIQCLMKFDYLCTGVDALWLSGNLSDNLRRQENYSWQQRIVKLSNRIINTGMATSTALKESQKKAQSEEGNGLDPAAASLADIKTLDHVDEEETEHPDQQETLVA